jgi:hypothetical protein
LAAEAPLQKEKASERGPFVDALKRVQAQLSVQLAELEAMLARGKSDTPAMSKKSAVSADSVEKRREAYRVLFL